MKLFDPDSTSSLRRGKIRYFPAVPGRMEFAEAVRAEIVRERPGVVAVELPLTLQASFERAVERLPELSVIIYKDEAWDGEGEQAVYVPVEAADPFVEALRTGRELGCQTAFLDPDIGERPHLEDDYPDPYALRRLGLERYIDSYRVFPQPRSRETSIHAEALAWKLQGVDPDANILVVVSLNLLDPLLDAMERPQAQPLRRARRKGIQTLNLHPESLAEVLTDFPFLQAVYETRRSGKAPRTMPEPQWKEAFGFSVIDNPKQARTHEAAIERAARHEPDRQRLHFRLFAEAEKLYEHSTGERIAHWQRRLWARFSRNLALLQHQLLGGLFDLTVAARSIIDDNFAWELWDLASAYPWQKTDTDLVTVKVSGEQMWLRTRKIQLRRRTPRKKGRARPVGLKGRKREKSPGEWKREWRGASICSYPPEDLVIEDYGLYLKKKGRSILSEERSRVEPFTTSLLDGVDLRETLRNWHERRIYVRANQRVSGEVGAIVLIFDEDRDNRYPYCLTWLGEHQNESDMAFYATDPYANIVGPGIGRAEYGGLLLSLPSQRMLDVWSDSDYWFAESKPEKLLLAALDYSLEKFVVYVAAKPPRSAFRSIASRLGRKIIYIPIGQLSPTALKKVRVMHVLDGHDKRAIAKDYIW